MKNTYNTQDTERLEFNVGTLQKWNKVVDDEDENNLQDRNQTNQQAD